MNEFNTRNQNGLFGGNLSSEVYRQKLEQERQQAAEAQALQFARMDPFQRATYSMYRAGDQLGGAIGSYLGAEGSNDPRLALYNQEQQLQQGVDYNSPQALADAGSKALQAGNYKLAQEFAAKLQTLQLHQAKLNTEATTAQARVAEKLTPEQRNAAAKTDASGLERGTPEWMAAFRTNLDDLTAKPGQRISFGEHAERIARAAFGKSFAELSPAEAQKVNAQAQQEAVTKASAGKTVVSVDQRQENEFSKQLGKDQAAMLKDGYTDAQSAARGLNNLATMEKTNANGVFSGPAAQGLVKGGQFLASVGLLSSEKASMLKDSETYSKNAADLVLQDLGGKLGAGVSNADVQFIKERVPQLENSPQARKELIAKMKEIYKGRVERYQSMKSYSNKNKNLNDWSDPFEASALAPTPTGKPRVSGW